ncbi:MAG: hypothetical protein EPO45_07935 [Sphingobium sp.]|nr:MAG: hypothetical protein EPO45_07935 [Sphingobium sp.]
MPDLIRHPGQLHTALDPDFRQDDDGTEPFSPRGRRIRSLTDRYEVRRSWMRGTDAGGANYQEATTPTFATLRPAQGPP